MENAHISGDEDDDQKRINPREDVLKYKDHTYWDNRFKEEKEYEWLCSFSDIEKYLLRDIKKDNAILILGCGNSNFSAELHDAGFSRITSVDFSHVVIEDMQQKFASTHPSLKWIVSDVRNLNEIPDDSFDVVIDKACIDALVCDIKDPWHPDENTKNDVNLTLRSIVRVMKSKTLSCFISVGFQQPHFRKPLFKCSDNSYGWENNIDVFSIDVGFGYFYMRCLSNQ